MSVLLLAILVIVIIIGVIWVGNYESNMDKEYKEQSR